MSMLSIKSGGISKLVAPQGWRQLTPVMQLLMNNKMPDTPNFTAHELLSSYHDGLKEAVDFVKSKVIGILSGQINLSQQEEAVLGIFFRTHALTCSLVRLNHKIDFNAVALIVRTIFELLLDIKMLSSPNIEPQDLDRFFSFSNVDRFRKASRIVELQNKHPNLVNNSLFDSATPKTYVEIPGKNITVEAKVDSLWGRNKKGKLIWPDHWSGSSIRNRAESFGPLYEQEYLEIYSLLSSYPHGGNSAYSGLSEEALESVYGISLEYARKTYIESLLICSEIFNLKRGIGAFCQVVTFLENAPEQILIKHGLKKLKSTENA